MDAAAYRDVLLRLSALERRINAVFRLGVAAEVTLDPYRVRLDIGPDEEGGPVLTDPLPVLVPAAGSIRVWSPVAVGERCGLLSPGGEDFSGFVLPGLYSEAFGAPDDESDRWLVQAAGGANARIERDEIRMRVGRSTLVMTDTDILLDSPHVGLND